MPHRHQFFVLPGDNVTAFRFRPRVCWLADGTTAGWDHRRSSARDDRMVAVGVGAGVVAAQPAGVAQDLIEAGLGNVEMLIEYQLPLTSKRADAVLAGVDRRTGGDAYVVVELKQRSQAELYEDSERLVLVSGMHRELEHPLIQVQGYCDYMTDSSLRCAATKPPCAASPTCITRSTSTWRTCSSSAMSERGCSPRVGGRPSLTTCVISSRRSRGRRGPPAAGERDRPSKQLMKLAASEIKDREQFVLLDEQRLAYQIVLHAVEEARRSDAKEIVVITGGPGSGKSVIALSLLGELVGRSTAPCTTGSRLFTQTMRQVAGRGSPGSRICSSTSTAS